VVSAAVLGLCGVETLELIVGQDVTDELDINKDYFIRMTTYNTHAHDDGSDTDEDVPTHAILEAQLLHPHLMIVLANRLGDKHIRSFVKHVSDNDDPTTVKPVDRKLRSVELCKLDAHNFDFEPTGPRFHPDGSPKTWATEVRYSLLIQNKEFDFDLKFKQYGASFVGGSFPKKKAVYVVELVRDAIFFEHMVDPCIIETIKESSYQHSLLTCPGIS